MALDVDSSGKMIEFKFDKAMVAEFKKGNFAGVEAVILRIVPIASPLPLLGLSLDAAEDRLAKTKTILDRIVYQSL